MTIQPVDIPGGRLLVESDGAGDPVVVLLHAGVTDKALWDGVVPALAESRRVVRYDLRGFGASSPPAAPFTHADDLLSLLDALEVERAVLVGASLGARVALEFAASHPGRVAGLALFASPLPRHDRSPAMRAYAEAEDAALNAGDLDAAVRLNLDMWVRGPSRAWDERLRGHAASVREGLRVSLEHQHLTDTWEEIARPDLVEVLGEIDVPALVAVGSDDVPDFVEIAGRLAAELPRARPVRLPGTGHLIATERPKETADILLTFLTELPTP
ncbi:alpha/beta fold hydrolase [Streptomyces sp. SBT349]|uniref:alpha/beta fold hydrolase n=1 Tax=Streptomyces sp. SBT349 TaxID=1580539 RepID=UPI00066EC40A|nr:alpha/beta hydrolase [Streptomyces sp. SBT349]